MANAVLNIFRLARAGFVFARHGVKLIPADQAMPMPVKLFRLITSPLRIFAEMGERKHRIANALASLGPTYIKLGQFLATRDDLIGKDNARDLSMLRDKMPPFSMKIARQTIEAELGQPVENLFVSFSDPIAAASIAQVHKAVIEEDGERRSVAVKILRPGIEGKLHSDMESYFFAARMIEQFHEPSRRLKPVSVVEMLAQGVEIEMDLRMEAAAMSEMAENIKDDPGFRVPKPDWTRGAKRVLTTEWVDGIPLSDVDAIKEAGHDLIALSENIIQSFLRHAMRDGFFHADMHQGNLFVDHDGVLVAVDFGIMGRIGPKEQLFLAEILYGFITRDYTRVAKVHFDAGYVQEPYTVEQFAQALRAIGEPLMDKTADEISMARVLGQLFEVTEIFDMQARPELVLLQKTMVVVEGVARTLNPRLNMWTISEPVVKEWMQAHLGVEGKLQHAAEGATSIGKFMGDLPSLLLRAESTAQSLSRMASSGLKLDDETIALIAREQSRQSRVTRIGIWVGAIALVAIAVKLFL
ncbi:MAG: 2-polyprenylphenol 6-hydroxylase [Methyloligellaceae bacterium]